MDFAHLDGLMADVDPADRDRIIMFVRSIGEPLAEAAQMRAQAAQRAADIMARLDPATAPEAAPKPAQAAPQAKAAKHRKDPVKVRAWVTRKANAAKAAGGQA